MARFFLLDSRLAEVFEPERVEHTLTQWETSQPDAAAMPDPLLRSIAEGDREFARHRAALEAGADPAMVAAWGSEVNRERAVLITQLTAAESRAVVTQRMGRDEIR